MNLSINGQCKVPPGFRFHPTEEELLQYYLKKKVAQEMIDLDVIPCVDLNKLEPWDIQEKCRIGSGPQNEWYFFSRKDKKYPSGTRTNRATEVGFWKATGRDKIVYNNSKRIGLRKTLVFYIGRAPSGQKSDWIMYEYRLEENTDDANNVCQFGELNAEDWWVVCRLFKKKNCKAKESPENSSTSPNMSSDQAQFSSPHKVTYSKQENKSNGEIINMINNNNTAKLQASINTILSEMKTPSNPLLGNSISSALDDDQDVNYEVCGYTVDNILPGIEYSNCDNRYPYGVNIESYEELGFSQIVQHLQLPYLCSSTPNQATEVYSNDVELWSFT